MKYIIIIIISSLILFSCQKSPTERVILLGIDALSTDGLQSAKTPNLNRLIKDGALSLKARGVMPTVSAPNWGSMLTGAGPEQHGMTENGWTTTNYKIEATVTDSDGYFPSIFNIIKEQRSDLNTAIFYDWKQLLDLYNEKYIDQVELLNKFDEVYDRSIEIFKENIPEFSFIYVGHVDEVGHELGHGTEAYYHSIEEVDAKIGELLELLDEKNLYESTHIIVISDHGGVGYGHGGVSMAEIQVPWIIKGPGISENVLIEEPVNTLNSACTIAYLFDLEPHDHWIGKPVYGAFENLDASKNNSHSYIPKPKSSVQSGIHSDEKMLSFTVDMSGGAIFYTTDGSLPDENSIKYSNPIPLKESKMIKAVSLLEDNRSEITEVDFLKVLDIKSLTLYSKPSSKYPAEFGGRSLIDGILGSDDYTHAAWMGFEFDDLQVIADLGSPQKIKNISLSCMENEGSWIFLPSKLEIYGSLNGVNYFKMSTVSSSEINPEDNQKKVRISKSFSDANYRYLKIKAQNVKYCPEDHPGAGGKAWLFVDELIVE
jgi:hypothetical protein